MIRIAEKLGFMKVRAAMVCARVGIGRKVRHKKPCIRRQFSIKLPRNPKSLTVQREFGKIIDVIRRKLCCLRVYLGNVR